jgi:hypothetical protein
VLLSVLAAVIIISQPGRSFEIAAYIFMWGVGVCIIVLIVLKHAGWIQSTYTDAERGTLSYRMERMMRRLWRKEASLFEKFCWPIAVCWHCMRNRRW